MDQKSNGSKSNDGMDQKSNKNELNLNAQMEKLAMIKFQDKFLNGARAHDYDVVIIHLEKSIIDNSDYYAAWAVDQNNNNPVVLNHRMMLLMENGTFSGVWQNMDEINSVKLLKSHMPVMNRSDGPEVFLAK